MLLHQPSKDRVYVGIHIEGKKPRRKFWKNLVFDDSVLADFFFEQEIISIPEHHSPERFNIDNVEAWEVEGRNALKTEMMEYKLPPVLRVMLLDYFEHDSMMLKMELNDDRPPNFFYSTKIAIAGSPMLCENDNDLQTFGIRLRPKCSAPSRTARNISLEEDGLPGLWYFTVGYSSNNDTMPIFFDELNHCMLCPYRDIKAPDGVLSPCITCPYASDKL
jgi:hypothetical protein